MRGAPTTRTSVRVRPVPPLDPPFDDESTTYTWWRESIGQLALDLPTPLGARVAGSRSRYPRAAAGRSDRSRPASHRPAGDPAPAGPPPDRPAPGALATASPEARHATRRFLGCCLEILDGHRPIGHLRRLCHPADAADLITGLTAAVRRLARPPGMAGRRPDSALRVRALRVCEPKDGVAEVAAVLGRADRSWALALRLERHPGGWLGKAIELL